MNGSGKIGSINSTGIEPLVPQTGQTTAPSGTTSQAPVATRDAVEAQRPDVSGGSTSVEQRLADLENTVRLQREREVQQAIADADEAKKPDLGRAALEFFTTFGRALPLIGRLMSFFAAAFRLLRIAFMVVTGKGDQIDGNKELIGLGVDAIGIFVPLAGALGSAAKALWFEDSTSEILGGMNLMTDDVEKDSAIRLTADRIKEVAVSAYEGAKRIVTGGDSVRPADGQVPFQPLTPAEVPVG